MLTLIFVLSIVVVIGYKFIVYLIKQYINLF